MKTFSVFTLYYLAMSWLIYLYDVSLFPVIDGGPAAMAYTLGLFLLTLPIWLMTIFEIPSLYFVVSGFIIVLAWCHFVRRIRRAGAYLALTWLGSGALYIGLRLVLD